jgi:hypothetical protein
MNTIKIHLIAGATFALASFASFAADDLPTTQPKVLSIIREKVKMGQNAAHARNEQGWPAALEKAKHPYYYLALTSISGPNEAWYIIPYASNAQMGDEFKRADDNPVLSAELDRLSADDAQYVSETSTIHANARPDLSYGDFPDLVQMRFYEITMYSVRPGRERDFEAVANAYIAATKRAGIKTGFRTYEVAAGLPTPTFLVFSSTKDLGELDKGMDEFKKTMGAATDAEKETMSKGMRDAVEKELTNRFRVDPQQSYISKETRNKAPDFWLKK